MKTIDQLEEIARKKNEKEREEIIAEVLADSLLAVSEAKREYNRQVKRHAYLINKPTDEIIEKWGCEL